MRRLSVRQLQGRQRETSGTPWEVHFRLKARTTRAIEETSDAERRILARWLTARGLDSTLNAGREDEVTGH